MVAARPDTPALPAPSRVRMSGALLRLVGSRDPGARPVRRALAAAAAGRLSDGERRWATAIEARRAQLLDDERASGGVFVPAGESPSGGFAPAAGANTVAVSSAMLSLAPPWCVLLMKLVRHRAPRACIELGTGFGISAAYIAAGLELNRAGSLTTIEGSGELAELAESTLGGLGLTRADVRVGPIDELLDAGLERAAPWDLAFIDAEHQAAATVEHFEALLPRLADGAVVVLDDVNWEPMLAAQRRIAAHGRVSSSAIAGRLGICVVAGGRR